ncbi:trithorax group protein osa-like [Anopheles cruzii]|uniref:trithorax group protein osa-like n=1 Tax=Anopheles cruzii TaxID=68878 RepID=UPI0022EC28AC|nr:trithorax group protein osa-like [Anopheles cruzii]
MASNGGTLHGLPQSVAQQQQQHICGQCGLYFESGSSLQVHHMHYHQHDSSMNRWDTQQAVVSTTIATSAVATTTTAAGAATTNGPSSTTTPTSSDTENNNQPSAPTQGPSPAGGLKPSVAASPPQQHTTIAAAADSSDNQPPTPQPQGALTEPGTPQSYGGGASPYHAQQQQQQQQQQLGVNPTGLGGEMHYPTYIHPGYDPGSYYGAGGAAGLDYGGGGAVLGASLQSADYKSASSLRYHPYGGGAGSNGGSDGGSTAAGLSPHVVSSSNGVQSAGAGNGTPVASTTSASSSQSPPNGNTGGGGAHIPPTPSPSPIQCEKCGLVCESDEALHQHESTVHSPGEGQTAGQDPRQTDQDMQQAGGGGGCYPYGGNGPGTPQFPKEEPPASDILDLDSQKMVYTPTADGGGLSLPPMNSLHPLQSMQRHHPMMWPHHDPHSFMGPPPPPPEMKHSAAAAAAAAAAYYHHPIKSEYSATPTIKSEYLGGGQYVGGGGVGTGPVVVVKNEYNLAPTLPPPVAVAPQPTNPGQGMKQYADEMHDNQLATSPSDFPSTTTPQESGSQYRTFEPATSSLPGPGPGPTKGTAWKSNEARRPKTYNCTACNKWFTSSGHLKRHYNTTLHKNAVKSSGQPDPATLPISVHHHPGRDPNYASKSRRGAAGATGGTGGGGGGGGSQQPLQQPVPPPDPPRSPEYGAGAPGSQHQYGMGGPQSGFGAAAGTPPHSGGQVVVVSSNQSPGGFHHHPHHHSHHHHHHPYAGSNGTAGSAAAGQSQHHGSSTSASSSTSSAVPPNGVAGPSVQVSQPRGLQIYSNNNNSNSNTGPLSGTAESTAAEEPVTHTIITILTPTTPQPTSTTTSSTTTIPGCTPGTRTPQPPPLPPPQPQPPHTTSSTEGYHPLHPIQPPPPPQLTTQPPPTTCSPLTISTSIPSFQTILPEAPSYHPTIGNVAGFASYHSHQPFLYQPLDHHQPQLQGDVQQQQHWLGDGGEALIESTSSVVTTAVAALGFPRCAGGAEMYQGDTAPPFSPNVPDQYQRPSSQGMMTTLLDDQPKYGDFQQQQQQHHYLQQQQQLQRVATPQHAATAPPISPAPCSPSVTSTAGGKQSVAAGNGGGNGTGSPPSSTEVHRCEECDKVFNKACYLTQHNKTFHSGDKPYKCHRCGKRFPCNDSYEEHLAKHGGEKPFKCDQCPKQFNHKTDLRRHMCLHSGTKPYACEQCGKGFIRKDHMLKHSETHRRSSGAAGGAGGHGHRRTKAGPGLAGPLKDLKFQHHLQQQQAPGLDE